MTSPKGVAEAWLAAFNNHDAARLASLGTTGMPSNLKEFQKAASLTDKKPIISNINITGQEKSFFSVSKKITQTSLTDIVLAKESVC